MGRVRATTRVGWPCASGGGRSQTDLTEPTRYILSTCLSVRLPLCPSPPSPRQQHPQMQATVRRIELLLRGTAWAHPWAVVSRMTCWVASKRGFLRCLEDEQRAWQRNGGSCAAQYHRD